MTNPKMTSHTVTDREYADACKQSHISLTAYQTQAWRNGKPALVAYYALFNDPVSEVLTLKPHFDIKPP